MSTTSSGGGLKARRGIFSLSPGTVIGGGGVKPDSATLPPPHVPVRPNTRGSAPATVTLGEFTMPLRKVSTPMMTTSNNQQQHGRPPLATSQRPPVAPDHGTQLPRVSTSPSMQRGDAFANHDEGTPTFPLAPSSDLPPRGLASRDASSRRPPLHQPATTFGSRPSSQQRTRATLPSSASSRSAAHQQSEFHRGLVSALQDVLKQQRHGIFPGLSTPSTPLTREQTTNGDHFSGPMPSRPATRESGFSSTAFSGSLGPTPSSPTWGIAAASQDDGGFAPAEQFPSGSDTIPMMAQDRDAFPRPRFGTPGGSRRGVRNQAAGAVPRFGADAGMDIMLSAATVQMLKTLQRQEASARQTVASMCEREHDELLAAEAARAVAIMTSSSSSAASSKPRPQSTRQHDSTSAPLKSKDPNVLRTEGNEHYVSRRFVAAHGCYSQAMEADPQSVVLLTNRAAVYTMLLNYDACVRDCIRATTIDQASWKAYSRMARALALSGQYAAAARHYTTALLIVERLLTAAAAPAAATLVGEEAGGLAAQFEQLKTERGALQYLEKSRRESEAGNHAAAVGQLALAATFTDEPPMRLMRVASMLHIDPTGARSEISKYLATLEQPPIRQGRGDDVSGGAVLGSTTSGAAKGTYNPLLAHTYTHYCCVLVLAAQASLFCGVHFLNIATSHLQLCLAIKADHPGAALMLERVTRFEDMLAQGNELAEAGKHVDALTAFGEALAVTDSGNRKVRLLVLLQRAESHLQCGNTHQAISDCDAALAIDGNNLKGLTKRSRACETAGDWRRALLDLEHAATINTDLASELVALRLRAQQTGGGRGSASRSRPDAAGCNGTGGASRPGTQNGGQRPTWAPAPVEPTLYDALGVSPGCDPAAIRAAYRRLTLQLHPDKVVKESYDVRQQCEGRFKLVAHAYSVLSDPAARLQYDLGLR